MPELPEVETIRRSVQAITEQTIQQVVVRQYQLRFAIPENLPQLLQQARIQKISRRAKYLLFYTDKGTLIIHLGMSGRLRLYQSLPCVGKHDHVDIIADNVSLRFTDPRRFGAVLWVKDNPLQHRLLASLGVEPLSSAFTADYLWEKIHSSKIAIKKRIMDNQVVVGVGNIYASEALFKAKIHPQMPANQVSIEQSRLLFRAIRKVLSTAIACGGTTLKDFCDGNGDPGYFKQKLYVYQRDQQACLCCKTVLEKVIISGRSSVFCPQCQQLP